MRPTNTKLFSSPSFPASAKKKNSKMRAIRHTLRKLKVLLHLRHGKKTAIPRIVLTPPSESESDREEDDGEGSVGSRLDLRLGQGSGD
ncbi:unnamed protein product [Tuber melanosporum]|uniref:(Perigord truffle) hypothetical protein n=1 Tax=Tuber melanosporum (strain Mel28) TaxID=656061 RepID=D5GEC9_TUBMM|nr:uncharacterized protein GSTUM_00001270001 [Tuber melanosporum]CAZ82872.1 unnamed protein product [Tuber melanosporum]